MSQSTQHIGNDQKALRRVRVSEVRGSENVKKNAFLPSRSGKDTDGLSVSIESSEHVELHRAKFEPSSDRCACYVIVEDVRTIEDSKKTRPLDVVPAENLDDPRHALITGIPDRTLGTAELAEAEYLASKLAKLAKRYTFPAPEIT